MKGQHTLALKIPPLLVLIICAGLMWLISISFYPYTFDTTYKLIISLSILAIAFVIILASAFSFKKAQTTVNPTQPNKSSALVTSGVYRFTRNPMYLSFVFILLAWGAYLSAIQSLVLLPLFIAYITYLQIIPEEQALSKIFGQRYNEYKNNVRRWV